MAAKTLSMGIFARPRRSGRRSPGRTVPSPSCRRVGRCRITRSAHTAAPAHAGAAEATIAESVCRGPRTGSCRPGCRRAGPIRRRRRATSASVVLAVAQQNQRLAAGLFAHDLVRAEEDGVVEVRPAATATAPASAAAGISAAYRRGYCAAGYCPPCRWRCDLLLSGPELGRGPFRGARENR